MLVITCDQGKSGSITNDTSCQLTPAGERDAKPTQHLIFSDGYISFGDDFACSCENVIVERWGSPGLASESTY